MTDLSSSGAVQAAQQALEGVRVLDLSRILAAPWSTQFLGDLGAEVIKIERPGSGDDTRGWGPPFVERDGTHGAGGSDAAYFLCANRNKQSVTIDIADSRGSEIVRKIAANSDIFIENFKVGGLVKYGLDYPSIAAINPKIVYCSITGFGQDGPYSHRAGYDYMIQAMGGLMSITGQPDGVAGAEPMKVGVAVADLFAGMYAVGGMLAALRHAERTGEGQHVDIGLFDCQAAMLANQATNYLATGNSPERLGNAHPNIAPYQAVATSDGHLVLAVGNDTQFQRFCELIGMPALAKDDRFATNAARVENRAALNEEILPPLKSRTTSSWLEAFEAAGVPAGPINRVGEVLNDPQAQARGFVAPQGQSPASIMTHPVKYSRTPPKDPTSPPMLGGNTREVLSNFVDSDSLDALSAAGVIGD